MAVGGLAELSFKDAAPPRESGAPETNGKSSPVLHRESINFKEQTKIPLIGFAHGPMPEQQQELRQGQVSSRGPLFFCQAAQRGLDALPHLLQSVGEQF